LISNQQDIELWESYKKGDSDAFAVLFRNHYIPLFRFGNKFTQDQEILEDCIQELFLELWQNKNQTSVQSVKAYLFKSLKYKLYRAISRKADKATSSISEEMLFELSYEALLVTNEENLERALKLTQAFEQLSNRQKEIIYLKYYQELSYEEVSEIMNINYQAARNLIYQSVRALKKIILGSMLVLTSIPILNS
jgi:RNA polymerase sigma factor (sigma-70 family)